MDEIPKYLDPSSMFTLKYFDKTRFSASTKSDDYLYDLGIRINSESEPLSNPDAIRNSSAPRSRLASEWAITKTHPPRGQNSRDIHPRNDERESLPSYSFAPAQSEGIAVIDDPDGILRCSNKCICRS